MCQNVYRLNRILIRTQICIQIFTDHKDIEEYLVRHGAEITSGV